MSVNCERCGSPNPDAGAFCTTCGEALQPETATGALTEHTLLNGRYDVAGVLGRGAMGAVYKAHDLQQDEVVAIKEMSDEALGSGKREQAVDQFRREALLLQALSNPHLVRVRDVFTTGHRHYLAMDFVEGMPLSEVVPIGSQASETDVRDWALQLCDVLAYLHSRQPPVVFRDLKPENVMRIAGETDAGSIKLIDFGIARFFDPQKEQDTMAIGTRGYMAPEAFHGQTDARSDLYSLGVMLYALLTGFDPAESPWDLPEVRAFAPDVSEDLVQIIAHATQLTPDERFQTASEFKRALGGEVLEVEAPQETGATPAAARVSTDRPVWFNGRERITSLEQLVALCDRFWEAGVNHMRLGELENWLDHLDEVELERYAQQLRETPGADMNVQLETWLESTGIVAYPQIEISPPLHNLGAVNAHAPVEARFRVRNAGRGYLVGQVQSDAYWLYPTGSWIVDNDGLVTAQIDPSRMPVNQMAEGRIHIQSNAGSTQATVRLRPTPLGRNTTVIKPPTWAAGALLLLAVLGGGWLTMQLAERWHFLDGFNVEAWLEGGNGWLILPVATLCLALAAMLGSMFQWERLAADAPLRLWGFDALWALGLTFLAILGSALVVTYVFPELVDPSPFVPMDQVQSVLPLLLGGLAALATASGWGARKRQSTGGLVSFLVFLGGWLLITLVGAIAGLLFGQVMAEAGIEVLDSDFWWGLVLLGALLGAGLVYVIARAAGLLRTPKQATWTPSTAPPPSAHAPADQISGRSVSKKAKRERQPLARGYWLAIPGALLALISSFLPWIIVSANSQLLHRWNVFSLAGRSLDTSVTADLPAETMPLLMVIPSAGILLLLLALVALIRGRRSWLDVIGPILLAAIPLTLLAWGYLDSRLAELLKLSADTMSFEIGFWAAIIGLLFIFVGSVINFVEILVSREAGGE